MSEKFHLTDEQKTVEGLKAVQQFFDVLDGFPNDIYKEVLLEEFFKFILEGEYDLSLLENKGPQAG